MEICFIIPFFSLLLRDSETEMETDIFWYKMNTRLLELDFWSGNFARGDRWVKGTSIVVWWTGVLKCGILNMVFFCIRWPTLEGFYAPLSVVYTLIWFKTSSTGPASELAKLSGIVFFVCYFPWYLYNRIELSGV